MTDLVKIEKREIEKTEYKGQPVVTLAMVDELHERPEGTARRNFNRNQRRLIEGEDYFRVSREHAELFGRHNSYAKRGGDPSGMVFLTETGYLMLVKSLRDDLAWKVQRSLVMSYFNVRRSPAKALPEPTADEKRWQAYRRQVQINMGMIQRRVELAAWIIQQPHLSPQGILHARDALSEATEYIKETPDGPKIQLF